MKCAVLKNGRASKQEGIVLYISREKEFIVTLTSVEAHCDPSLFINIVVRFLALHRDSGIMVSKQFSDAISNVNAGNNKPILLGKVPSRTLLLISR